MRLSALSVQTIKTIINQWDSNARIYLFGSRLDDNKRGGDIDLLIETSRPIENPAWEIARLSSTLSRLMQGRKVDVVLDAPNLEQQAIHQQAKSTGLPL